MVPEEDMPGQVREGESILLVEAADILVDGSPTEELIVAKIAEAIGRQPLSSRCAVVDPQGVVVNVISADPVLDVLPGFTLIQHDTAWIGWITVNGVLVDPTPHEEPDPNAMMSG
jgi:hypothetical protein